MSTGRAIGLPLHSPVGAPVPAVAEAGSTAVSRSMS